MSKRTVYTNITALPSQVTRDIAVDELHDHAVMIKLNPLVINFERCLPHKDGSPDEYHCIWYEITDKVSYLPGIKGQVKYKACFFDRPLGLQTHCFAPAGLDIKAKWSVGGNMPGEPREARELGVDTPREGLYLREDVDMHCNIMLTSFVKKNLKTAHAVLVDRLLKKVEIVEDGHYHRSMTASSIYSSMSGTPTSIPGALQQQQQQYFPQQYGPPRSEGSASVDGASRRGSTAYSSPVPSEQQFFQQSGEDQTKVASPPPLNWRSSSSDPRADPRNSVASQQRDWNMRPQGPPHPSKSFPAELPGSHVMPAEMFSPPMGMRPRGQQNAPQELDSGHRLNY